MECSLYQLNIVCIFVSVDNNNYSLLHNEKFHYKYCFVSIKYSLTLLDLCDLSNYIALLFQSNAIWNEEKVEEETIKSLFGVKK